MMTHRYACVTAGAQGLGRALVRHLAQQHYFVLFQYYSSQRDAEALFLVGGRRRIFRRGG